jgi:hypothetical protein
MSKLADEYDHAESIEFLLSSQPDENSSINKLYKLCALNFTLVIIGDLINSLDFYAVSHDWILTQMATGLVNQLVWLWISFSFITAGSTRDRIAVGLSQALASTMGSTIMLAYIKPLLVSVF